MWILSTGSSSSVNDVVLKNLMVKKWEMTAIVLYFSLYYFKSSLTFRALSLTFVDVSRSLELFINSVIFSTFYRYSMPSKCILSKNSKYFFWFSNESFLINQNSPSASTLEKSNSGYFFFFISILLQTSELCLKVSLSKGSTIWGQVLPGSTRRVV